MNECVLKVKNKIQEKQKNAKSIEELINKSIDSLAQALPKYMSAERLARIALTTIRLNPKLSDCTPQSFLAALFQCAQLGLEPNIEGQAYIIPYNCTKKLVDPATGKDKYIKVTEAQFQIGYKGYIELFYRHGAAAHIDMHTVYENDLFEFSYGTDSYLEHCPKLNDRGEPIAYYAIAKLKDGGSIFKVMSRDECIEHGKTHSKCYISKEWNKSLNTYVAIENPHFDENSPWAKDLNAMCKKTVLIQLAKCMPKSIELQKALSMDNTTKLTVSSDMSNVPDVTSWDNEVSSSSILPPEEERAS